MIVRLLLEFISSSAIGLAAIQLRTGNCRSYGLDNTTIPERPKARLSRETCFKAEISAGDRRTVRV
jgi:hypothetical protein